MDEKGQMNIEKLPVVPQAAANYFPNFIISTRC